MHHRLVPLTLAAGLAACSANERGGESPQAQQEASVPAAPERGGGATVVAPQIAYTYGFSFTVPADRVAAVQARHVALCDRLGAACRVVAMERMSGEHGNVTASLELAVDARRARRFGDALVAAATDDGGTASSRSVASEDLTKQIVDIDAHLRGRQALADRLLGIVRTRGGSVADLVAAEKALGDVQEEIDTARSRLAAARGRVALSTMEISYAADGASGVLRPIREAAGSLGAVVGQSLAALLIFVVAILPWGLLAAVLLAAWRAWRRREASRRA